jgi:hypothetical protein
MRKIWMIASVTICSWLGWTLGADFGAMTAYMLSFAGSLVGVVLAVWVNQKYLA